MRNGHCPKCEATTIYTYPQGVYFHNNRVFVRTGGLSVGVPFISYVCTSCGYFENYIADPGKLADLAKMWQKVPPAEQ